MTQQPIIIKGRLAKQIYEQLLKHDKGFSISNEGTAKMPVLRLREW